ncbi:MAG: hypothetical protein ACLQU2_21970 [Candidatus Binataceae bacterium]
MYRDIPRTNGMTEATVYGLDETQQAINSRDNADVLQADSAVNGEQPEALVAAVSFGTLLLILLGYALQTWL